MPEWIIAITDEERKKRALVEVGSGICSFLSKPFDYNELLLLLNNFLEVKSLRKEVSDKTKKVSHLEVVNEIAHKTLLSQDEDELLWNITRLIHEKMYYYNVNIFLKDEEAERVVLKAFAGGFGEDFYVGYSLELGEGIVGWVAQNREALLSGDVRKESRRLMGFSFEKDVLSELAVPIIFEDKVLGVVHVESVELNAFTHEDVMALETVTNQIALAIEKSRISLKLLDAYMLSTTITDSLPVFIVLVDSDLKIR